MLKTVFGSHSRLSGVWCATVCTLAAGVLWGCQALPKAPQQPSRWDLGSSSALPWGAKIDVQAPAVVLEVVPGAGLAEGNVQILYRLRYAQDHQQRAYQQAQWAQPPMALVEQRLRESLSPQYTVLRAEQARLPSAQGQWPWVLHAELEAFEQVFLQPSESVGRIRLRVTWSENGASGERLRGQKLLAVDVPARTPDVAGGVRALSEGMQQISEQFNQWLAGK